MELKNRKVKREVAADFAAVLHKDDKGRPTSVLVPGSQAKQYKVILRRQAHIHTIECECLLCTGKTGEVPCQGNSHSLCYHSQAAVNLAAQTGSVSWCKTEHDANLVSKFNNGTVVRITSRQCKKAEAWVVFGPKRDQFKF
jgi:hypothetical protein